MCMGLSVLGGLMASLSSNVIAIYNQRREQRTSGKLKTGEHVLLVIMTGVTKTTHHGLERVEIAAHWSILHRTSITNGFE